MPDSFLSLLSLRLATLMSPTPSSSPLPAMYQQPILPSIPSNDNLASHFRPAIESDLPAITTIVVEAFSPSALWNYLMPELEERKEDLWNCTYDQITQGWKHFNREKAFLNVITVPLSSDDDNDYNNSEESEEESKENVSETAVSVAVWNIRTRPEDASSSSTSSFPFTTFFFFHSLLQTCLWPPGINLTRSADYDRQIAPTMEKYFHSDYPKQLYLNLLATHPDWDGNGFAARQLRWGMDLSRVMREREGDSFPEEKGGLDVDLLVGEGRDDDDDDDDDVGKAKKTVPVTLLATPAGWPVYEGEGFEGVENVTIGMLDGLGDLWFEVCKWDG